MLTLVLLVAGLAVGAQETGSSNSENTESRRPAETEILLDAPESVNADGEAVQQTDLEDAAELPGIGFGDFVRMVLVLGIVIALIYGFFWMLKRFSGVKAESEDTIRLLSTRPLKGDAALHLVEVGSRMFLVGSAQNGVNLVSEIDDKESIDEIKLTSSQSPKSAPGGFARLFKDKFGMGPIPSEHNRSAIPETPTADQDPASYLKRQKERLKDL